MRLSHRPKDTMLTWTRERYCWVPQLASGTLRSANITTRMLLFYLAKIADSSGSIHLGSENTYRALIRIVGVHPDERRAFLPVVEGLVKSPCVALEGERLTIHDYRRWQTGRDTRRRLYERESGTFALLRAFPRMLAAELIRVADDDGAVLAEGSAETLAAALCLSSDFERSEVRAAWRKRLSEATSDLVKEGFLQHAKGLTIRNFAAAQERVSRRAEVERAETGASPKRPQLDASLGAQRLQLDGLQDPHTTPTAHLQHPHRTPTGRLQDAHTTPTAPSQDAYRTPTGRLQDAYRTPTGPNDVTTRNDYIGEPPSVPFRSVPFPSVPAVEKTSETPTPTFRSAAATPAVVEGTCKVAEKPFALTSPDDEPATKPKKGRGVIGERPDTIPAEGTPAFQLYRAIIENDRIRPLIGNPGEFALSCMTHNYRNVPADVLVWQVNDAGMFLASPACRRPPTFKGGWQFLRNQFDMAATKYLNAPKPAPPIVRDGRHTPHASKPIGGTPMTSEPHGVTATYDALEMIYGNQ